MKNSKDNKKVTIEDIAKATGFSRGTVSRAFNQRSDINKNTRRKVLDTARKMNYLPNPSARGLAKGKSECVGIVVPNLLNPFFAEMVTRLEVAVRAEGLSAILGTVGHDVELQESVLIRMASGQVDGLIMTPCESPESITQLNWINKRVPVISLKQLDGLECDTVMCNDSLSVKLVVDHLLELGHEKIAYVTPNEPESSVAQRFNAYENTLKSAGKEYSHTIKCDYKDSRDDDNIIDAVVDDIIELKNTEGVTAIVAYDDIIAMLIMKKLQRKGYTVPTDISIAGIDNISFSQFGSVTLTSAAAETSRLCELAIECLNSNLKNGRSDELRNVVLKPKLYARESTAPPTTVEP